MTVFLLRYLLFLIAVFPAVISVPERGKWDLPITSEPIWRIRSLFKDSKIYVRISCEPMSSNISVQANMKEMQCWQMIGDGMIGKLQEDSLLSDSGYKEYKCGDRIEPVVTLTSSSSDEFQSSKFPHEEQSPTKLKNVPNAIIRKDGIYFFIMKIKYSELANGNIHIEMKSPYGYLSADEWPLLPFYGAMCLIYIIFSMAWMLISFIQWRDLLRIQFWIGAVIFIGMIEKALFYEEYQSVNSTGESSFLGTVFIAEIISAAKRSLARILVIIVSLGYGIVKPRLGSHFPKIIAVGITYFTLASAEAYLRVVAKPNNNEISYLWLGEIPLALLDSFFCWWIFSSLVQTTRTLRLRRNLVKMTLYNRFTNTLIFAVIASTIFMLYSIKARFFASCMSDWSSLWIDQAFWHFLFSVILLVIMLLWRPTNNNQRYAFSPLLDALDDEDDDEEVEHFVSDAYGVKMRGVGSNRSDSPKSRNMDDDLTWVEENIPSFIDTNLPILDSDEELINTKFEISKMQ